MWQCVERRVRRRGVQGGGKRRKDGVRIALGEGRETAPPRRMAQRNGRRRTGTPGETRGLPRAEGEGESCTREAREVEGGYEKRWSKSDYITYLYV